MAGNPIEGKEYNLLPEIREAHAIKQGGELIAIWLKRIAPILAKEDPSGIYELSLVHRHHLLLDQERMVTTGLVTRPETGPWPKERVIPSAWTIEGRPYEWTRLSADDDVVEPPPQTLFCQLCRLFGNLCRPPGLGSVVGISIRSPPLEEGYIWWEIIGNEPREHVIKQRLRTDAEDKRGIVRTSWIPKLREDQMASGMEWIMVWCCICSHPNPSFVEAMGGKN